MRPWHKLSVLFLYLFILIISGIYSCKDEPVAPPIDSPKKDTISVAVEYVTHRSVNLKIRTTNYNPPQMVNLYRYIGPYPYLISRYSASTSDTIIFDDNNGAGLTSNSAVRWYAALTDSSGTIRDTSRTVEASLLDTTSHNYLWQEYSTKKVMNGIWGIDENNVWVIGSYLLKWNGTAWIADSSVGGDAIYGFSPSDIWAVGGGVWHYDGNEWTRLGVKVVGYDVTILDTILYRYAPYYCVWGTSSSNLYFGSGRGRVVHWNGTKAVLTEVNSPHQILDMWGFSADNIYAVAGAALTSTGILWHYDGISWTIERTGGPNNYYYDTFGTFTSVWGYNPNELFLLAYNTEIKKGTQWVTDYSFGVFMHRIRGSNSNNVFACGAFGTLAHYNGNNWRIYQGIKSDPITDIFVTENKVFVVATTTLYIGQKQ